MKKKLNTAETLLLLFAVAVSIAGCSNGPKAEAQPSAPAAPVVKVERKTVANDLEIASELLPFQEIDVYAKVSGYIQKLNVDYGTHVRKDDTLAVLVIPELQQQLAQDEALVRASEQNLGRAKEEVTRAQSAYDVAHVTYTRMADVQKARPELMSQQEIDEAQGKDLQAGADVSAAKDALSAAEQSVDASEAADEKDKALYAYSRITAPFDGVVTRIDAFTGALLPAGTSSDKNGTALCHLSQNSLLRLAIPVPERAVPDIHIGEMINVAVSSLNQTFKGQIVRTADQIDDETRTMRTEVNVPNAKFALVPGMYASVQIPLRQALDVLALPIQAVSVNADNPGKGSVLLVGPGNKLEARDVTLGVQSASNIEITSGLKEGDAVVFGAQAQFHPDEAVTPKLVDPSLTE